MVHVGARKATAAHMYFMYVCVCVHRATCSTVDKVEKVEKVSLKQYGNTEVVPGILYTTFVYFGKIYKLYNT